MKWYDRWEKWIAYSLLFIICLWITAMVGLGVYRMGIQVDVQIEESEPPPLSIEKIERTIDFSGLKEVLEKSDYSDERKEAILNYARMELDWMQIEKRREYYRDNLKKENER